MKEYVKAYNKLVPLMNKLSNKGYDIWENHDKWSGYGFKVIFKDSFIRIYINIIDGNTSYHLEHQEKTGNILVGKTITSLDTIWIDAIEDFIKTIA